MSGASIGDVTLMCLLGPNDVAPPNFCLVVTVDVGRADSAFAKMCSQTDRQTDRQTDVRPRPPPPRPEVQYSVRRLYRTWWATSKHSVQAEHLMNILLPVIHSVYAEIRYIRIR